ncbi:hypothetical protein [Phenylobacterium sp.]|uniref:terminase small subunit-like protein n=1 Tax=Phenylobacterium sp. TaxID=1871053 RepID=UPI00393FB38E
MPSQHWFHGEGEWWPAVDHSAGWKESEYHPAIGREILRRVARGWTIRRITADPDMPSYATLFHWVRTIPEFGDDYRELRAELAAERVEKWDNRAKAKAFWGPHKAKVLGRRWRRPPRRSSYTTAKGRAICVLLREGWTMSRINARPDMPSARVVYRWLKTEPEFREMVAEARAWRLGWLAFQAQIATGDATPGTLAAAKAFVARLEGEIGRWQPKVWGRKARW